MLSNWKEKLLNSLLNKALWYGIEHFATRSRFLQSCYIFLNNRLSSLKAKFFETLLKLFLPDFWIIKILLPPKGFAFGKMKLLAFILSFIILGLSCLPCSDTKVFPKNDVSSSIEIVKTHSEHQSSHQDLCNPFCSCFCCGTTSEIPKALSVVPIVHRYISSYEDTYTSNFIQSVFLPVWQPPQLSA